MDCDQALTLISARLDQEFPSGGGAGLEAHLLECAACNTLAGAFHLQDEDLHRAFAPRRRAAVAVAERVIARLETVASIKTDRSRPRLPRRLAWVLTMAALLSGLAILLSVLLRMAPDKARRSGDSRARLDLVPDIDGSPALIPAHRAPVPPGQLASLGESIRTGAGERRRVTLPDNSVLYLNQDTTVTVDGPRRVTLSGGEVYVEVEPREQGSRDDTFIVRTGRGEVAALGTKFDVRADEAGAGVLVTQGKVRVSGLQDPIRAGEQLPAGGGKPTAAPRASHLLDWIKELMTAAESPLVPASRYGGGALIAVDPYGQEAKLSLRKYHVDVHIEDGFARTTIDQTYFNRDPWRLEGTFYFPLPPDASLSRLAMYVDGHLMEGGMAERESARNIYEQIMYSQRDPALLEWVDGSTFKMRVFPLEGRQEKRIILSYTQKLESLYGRTRYRFPAGHSLQAVGDWSFHARLKNGAGLAWNSTSHELKAAGDGADLLLDAAGKDVRSDRDVVLTWNDGTEVAPAGDRVRFSSSEDDSGRYLMLRYRPFLPVERPASNAGRRNWVFLFESSGDRDPLLARVQVDVIRTLLANVEHDDTFTVLTAGTYVRSFAPQPLPATPENVGKAVEFLEHTRLIGALDLGRALTEAEPLLKAGANSYLVHVGSGVPAMGERREDVLARRVPEGVTYVGVGVGKHWSRSLMKAAAERSGGYFTQVNPDEPVAWRAFELFSTLNTPRLLNVKVVDNAERAVFLSDAFALSQGEELCAIARIGPGDGLPESVTVTGTLDGQPFRRDLPVRDVAGHADYLPRTWAKLEIDRLLAEDAKKNKDRVVALGKAMYVMTPFTSLLVLENEEMYQRFQVDRGRKDHWAMYPCPDTIPVVYEPDPSQPVDVRNAPKNTNQKPSAEQVMQTILVRVPPRFFTLPDQQETSGDQKTLTIYDGSHITSTLFNGGTVVMGGLKVHSQTPPTERDGVLLVMPDIPGKLNFNTVFPPDLISDLNGGGDVKNLQNTLTSDLDMPGYEGTSLMLPGGIGGRSGATRRPIVLQTRLVRTVTILGPKGPVQATVASPVPQMSLVHTSLGGSILHPPATVGQNFISENEVTRQNIHPLFRLTSEEYLPIKNDKELMVLHGLDNADEEGPMPDIHNPLKYDKDRWESIKRRSRGANHWKLDDFTLGDLLYHRPSFSSDDRIFYDLVAYAPGMNADQADILAVLEAEAPPHLGSGSGIIDPAARKLIDRARQTGWQRITIPAPAGASPPSTDGLTILCDGSGRYSYDRVLSLGLREQVICDSQTLWHLYPELGIGARRSVSRFHRAEFSALVPWALPPAEDLAHGADLKCVDDRTVVISPHDAETARDDKGQPVDYLCVHLSFALDGRLAERRLVQMPSGKTLYRETFSADGMVKFFDARDKVVDERKLSLEAAQEPSLKADTEKLVILPFPLRSRDQVRQTLKIEPNQGYENLDEEKALALFAAEWGSQNGSEALQIFGRRFHARGVRSLGFYTLLASCGLNVDSEQQYLDVLAVYPQEPLAEYLAFHSNPELRRYAHRGGINGPPEGFLQRLAAFRVLYLRWTSGRANLGTAAERQAEQERALDYVRRNASSPLLGPALLMAMQDQAGGDQPFLVRIAETWPLFGKTPGLEYVARYEQARSLLKAGRRQQARSLFADLYARTLKDEVLPPIDESFRQALQGDDQGDPEEWGPLMRQTASSLVAGKRRLAVIALAWQCWQVGDPPTADNLFLAALDGLADLPERLPATLAGIQFLMQTQQYARADNLLQPLLADPKFARQADLWRLGVRIADQRKMTAQSRACLERALDIEYEHLPEVIDLQAVRNDYGSLLAHYQQVVDAMTTLPVPPPKDLAARVVRAADRWRSLDRDGTAACQAAARILQSLGDRDQAWEYLTTPIGLQPNESGPWLTLAQSERGEGDFDLADRAYEAAFEAEPTNAQLLWDRAQNLQQAGRLAQAQTLYRQLGEGQWQPRFSGLQAQARWQLQSR